MLEERDLISGEQLAKALKQQKENGGYISQHLISLGFVSEKVIADCLANQYGFAYIPLADYALSPEILKLIPFKFIDIYSLLPVEKMGNVLSVAMADPLNEGVIDMLKQITKCDITVLVSTYSEIRAAIAAILPSQLKSIKDTEKKKTELLEKEILSSFIQVKGFDQKKEQRKYRRFEVNLNMIYYLRDKAFSGIVTDISYNGITFTSDMFLPIEKNIYVDIISKINLQEIEISAVIQILRVETAERSGKPGPSDQKEQSCNISAFFNFLTDEDRVSLATFLKSKLR